MKYISKIFLATGLLIAPIALMAQLNVKLACPLDHSFGREPKEAFTWEPKDLRVIMVSPADTIARSCIDATVSNINPTEDGKYEVVIYYKNYYFWYYGVTESLVKKGEKVKARQAIAKYKPGNELEFRMFKNEDPMDPRDMLECKIVRAGD